MPAVVAAGCDVGEKSSEIKRSCHAAMEVDCVLRLILQSDGPGRQSPSICFPVAPVSEFPWSFDHLHHPRFFGTG